ncbi:DNA-binding protein [Paracoccus limosus]|uniref:DNA-binding protein n=1 Tax=Paracoccus limosus TaxID=913252 RepID=A0A844HAI9_9RHOB|nr:phage antirepressor KilAC domain-containing protein [Paracoccus limosus]MTH36651.1 DNA-binding protein [Paracoccus limosus]
MNGGSFNVPSAGPLTMSSREIADLVDSRHDKVKQSMERLAEKSVITFTPVGEKSSGGRPGTVYLVNKRDSFVVVAQLCPEFTARLVDRWRQLEQERADGAPAPLTGSQLMAAALIEAKATLQAMDQRTRVAEQVVERIASAEGTLGVREAAKALGIGQNALVEWLENHRWVYRQAPSAPLQAYSDKITDGRMAHRLRTFTRPDGSERVETQAVVTGKGMAVLAKLIPPTARLIGGAQ